METKEAKTFKTHKEQLAILKERGLLIENDEEALCLLKKINYYRLTGYMLFMKKDDIFYPGSSIQQAVRMYRFDEKLRRILLGAIESIEISFKAELAYNFAKAHGPLGYLVSENFNFEGSHKDFLVNINEKIHSSRELFVVHHREEYGSQLPIWVAIELFTMGMLSKFFKNMLTEDKIELSKELYDVSPKILSRWLQSITILRNTCAHYSRVYNKKFNAGGVNLPGKMSNSLNQNKLAAFIYILKKMLTETEWKRFFHEFTVLVEAFDDVIKYEHMGFYEGWQQYIN
ncbi:Abi family protein [Bacillus licheniformis]|uniref:Abi family protein n=1 Tax=Bacillus licheniformis TaxID=1402 RepID=UPI001C63CD04|nr:Abi family protein [Bacillus licheniformis]MBW7635538.1 Abi family protein [Bacillus licheniformis]MDE1412882.1 Abi family protein [Bacillus licheniformis]